MPGRSRCRSPCRCGGASVDSPHADPVHRQILMPHTANENGRCAQLYQRISEAMPGIPIVTANRKYFNEAKGLECIRALVLPDHRTVEQELTGKHVAHRPCVRAPPADGLLCGRPGGRYYCLATCAAVIKCVMPRRPRCAAGGPLDARPRTEGTLSLSRTRSTHRPH